MTREQFIQQTEAYYDARLSSTARKLTTDYLSEYEEKNLPTLLGIVLKAHPLNFGVPAIAAIESAHRDYVIGDERKRIEGHQSLKRDRSVSATRPINDAPEITEEEREEVQAMMRESGGILGLIARGAV